MMTRGSNEPRSWNSLLRAVVWISAAIFLVGCGGGNSDPPSPSSASLSYPSSPLVFVVGTAITPVTPTASQTLTSFTVTPALPAGLTLNSTNGALSGTPTAVSAAGTYTVTATGSGASASASVSITVNDKAPSSVNYGAAAFTFTTDVAARTLTPSAQGGAVTSWSINPSLPAGLTFDASNGAISGTPSTASASTTYVVTARNSGGQSTQNLTIEVDSGVLLDVGHDAAIQLLRMSGPTVLSVDQSGHWNLWDYASGSEIGSGDLYCAPNCNPLTPTPPTSLPPHLADMAGGTAVFLTQTGFAVVSATTGQVLSNITASVTWWSLASDGSYLVAGSKAGLFAWSPSGNSLMSLAGDYSKAIAFAAPGQAQIAEGPSGQSVIQTVSVPGGVSTTGPAFSGQFSSWFPDGSRFITLAGGTALVYSQGSVQQAAIGLPAAAGPVVGQGNWVWTVSSGTLDVFAITSGSTPAATFAVGVTSTLTPSALTIAVTNIGTAMSVVDLSGTTPSIANYTLPIVGYSSALEPEFAAFESGYAALSASQWVVGNTWGVLLDGASLASTPRYLDYGAAWSIAGSSGSIAVATASGRIVYFDSSTLAQEGVIPFPASKVLLSSDGTLLAAAGDENDYQYNDDQSIRIYSLPAAGLLHTWPYSFASGVHPQDIALSGTGAVLGQVLLTVSGSSTPSYTQEADAATGGSQIFSSTFSSNTALTPPPPVRVSPDGTLIATSTSVPPSGTNLTSPGTNILQNGSLVTAVTGYPIGWIDDGHLLVNTYKVSSGVPAYGACSVYSATGQSTGPCALPEVTAFQTVTSDTLYAVNLGEILAVSTGSIDWMSGDSTSPSVGAVAGNRVVLLSGARVLAQGY